MADQPIKKEVLVTYNGETFTFKMPTIYDDIKTGVRARRILLSAADGDQIEDESAYDYNTRYFIRACAIFETQLLQTSAQWVHTATPGGSPVVDTSKFGPERAADVLAIVTDYSNQVDTFRSGRNTNNPPADDKAVASQ